jgi:FMN reductase
MNASQAAGEGGQPLNIIAVIASPHGGGSTASAAQTMVAACREAGARTNVIDLNEADSPAAVAAVEAADAVIFASPTYRASHTSLLGGFLEHLERGSAWESSAPLKGKATAVLMTGAAPEHFLATEKLRLILSSFFAAQVLSPSLFLTTQAFNDKQPTAATRDLLETHGRALVDLTAAVRSSKHLANLEPLV